MSTLTSNETIYKRIQSIRTVLDSTSENELDCNQCDGGTIPPGMCAECNIDTVILHYEETSAGGSAIFCEVCGPLKKGKGTLKLRTHFPSEDITKLFNKI